MEEAAETVKLAVDDQYVGLNQIQNLDVEPIKGIKDSLYNFCLLKKRDANCLAKSNFTNFEFSSIKLFMKELHEASPFKIGSSDFVLQNVQTERKQAPNQAPMNSFQTGTESVEFENSILHMDESSTQQNISEFNSHVNDSSSVIQNSISRSSIPSRASISYNTKEAILNMHRQFTIKQDDLHLHSITPASSLCSDMRSSVDSNGLTPIKADDKQSSFQSRGSISLNYDSLLKNIVTDDISEIEWNEKYTSRIELSQFPILEENSQLNTEEELAVGPSFALEEESSQRAAAQISYFVSLLPEESNEVSSLMWQSKDAIKQAKLAGITLDSVVEEGNMSEDEGSLHIFDNKRIFLKENASKNRFNSTTPDRPLVNTFVKIPQKDLECSDLWMSTIIEDEPILTEKSLTQTCSEEFPVFPNVLQPMCRKLVFWDQQEQDQEAQILAATACSGFNAAPVIKFSNTDKSSAYSDVETKLLAGLFDTAVASCLVENKAVWMSCGFEHCAIITSTGLVMTWGFGASGALGHGNTLSYTEPKIVDELANHCMAYIECGAYHNAAVTVDGDVFTWGRGDVNQLGISFSKLVKDDMGYFALYPQPVEDLHGTKIKSLACGEAHTMTLDTNGKVHCFGWGEDGQLGLPNSDLTNSVMSDGVWSIKGLPEIQKISCGSIFSTFLTVEGEVMIWGNGEQGQLGMGNKTTGINIPTKVEISEPIKDIICGESHSIVLCRNGKLYGWGQGIAGEFLNAEDQFPSGSEIIWFNPRVLQEVDTLHHYLFKAEPKLQENDEGFANDLYAKLSELQNMKYDSERNSNSSY